MKFLCRLLRRTPLNWPDWKLRQNAAWKRSKTAEERWRTSTSSSMTSTVISTLRFVFFRWFTKDWHWILKFFQDTEPTYYFGIFDGHSGSDAASYANSHLNYNIAVHPKYPSDIESAMREAFLVTDISFLKKAKAENLNSGTTALCAIYRKTEKKLFVGWCGDSQALIARVGNVRQIVKKHSPEDSSERKRIEDLGGVVLYWGNSYRVNGSLAVSRAIGDAAHKPYVSAEPEIEVINLDGEEDFIVLGCVSQFKVQ